MDRIKKANLDKSDSQPSLRDCSLCTLIGDLLFTLLFLNSHADSLAPVLDGLGFNRSPRWLKRRTHRDTGGGRLV
jgi:hypothetical protein